jgi:formylglycine-generating enzyme required for sulfatase activity
MFQKICTIQISPSCLKLKYLLERRNRLIKIIGLSVVLLMLLAAGSINAALTDEEFAAIMATNPLTPESLQGATVVDDKFIKANYQKMKVYDTRRKAEYLELHISGALSAPYKEKSSNSVDFDSSKDKFDVSKYPQDKDEPIILYCNGNRCWSCYKSAVMLVRAGYTNVHWYRNNGFPEWKSKGYPVEITAKGDHNNITAKKEMEFVFFKGGCFMMGDDFGEGSSDEQPLHKVCLDDFFMGKYEITVGQWKKVMGTGSSDSTHEDNYPIVKISWEEAHQFIKKINGMTGEGYRLPTEAEWEYAATAGGEKSQYATVTGNLSHNLCNFDGTAAKDEWIKTSPVGSFPPNPLGLFDLCGNVWEWVEDDYDYNAYKKHALKNPLIKTSGSEQVIRGCGWSDAEEDCRLTFRDKMPPDCQYCNRRNDVGFRLVKSR